MFTFSTSVLNYILFHRSMIRHASNDGPVMNGEISICNILALSWLAYQRRSRNYIDINQDLPSNSWGKSFSETHYYHYKRPRD